MKYKLVCETTYHDGQSSSNEFEAEDDIAAIETFEKTQGIAEAFQPNKYKISLYRIVEGKAIIIDTKAFRLPPS